MAEKEEEKTIQETFVEAVWPAVSLARSLTNHGEQPVTIIVTPDGATLMHAGMHAAYDFSSEETEQ